MRRWIRRFVRRRHWDLVGFIEEFGIMDAELRDSNIDPDNHEQVLEALLLQLSGGYRHMRPVLLKDDYVGTVSPLVWR